jgi:hypothetical protein
VRYSLPTQTGENIMANIKHFSDANGTSELFTKVCAITKARFEFLFPNGFSGVLRNMVGDYIVGIEQDGTARPINRAITYKANPSKHECNHKCMSGHKNGVCECSCGGKNHGINA